VLKKNVRARQNTRFFFFLEEKGLEDVRCGNKITFEEKKNIKEIYC
jgi:hypothetical protein